MRALGDDAPLWEGPWPEEQRGEYESGLARVGNELWRVRTARITPTKPGAFVAVWERDEHGTTQPFASASSIAGLMVFVEEGDRFGVFRFDNAQLEQLGVMRSGSHPGKRGFRLYPDWSAGLNPQAVRTRNVQSAAFVRLQ